MFSAEHVCRKIAEWAYIFGSSACIFGSSPPSLRQLSVAGTVLVTSNIRSTTRRYRKMAHILLTLRHAAKFRLQSSLNLRFLFGAIFSTGAPPSHVVLVWKTTCADYPKKAIIQSERGKGEGFKLSLQHLKEVSSLVRGWLQDHAIFFYLQLLSLAGNTSLHW